jgi:hypothetical protein
MKKKIMIATIVILLLTIFGLYINSTYFFSPLTFRQDNITYLPFTWYSTPMIYSYEGHDKFLGVSGYDIKNNADIRFIYKQLKMGKVINYEILKTKSDEIAEGILVINSKNSTVTHITWFGNDNNICAVNGQYKVKGKVTQTKIYIEMTPELKDFFDLKFKVK